MYKDILSEDGAMLISSVVDPLPHAPPSFPVCFSV